MSFSFLFFSNENIKEISPDAHQDPGRLLLLHLRSPRRAAGPRRPVRLHGISHDRCHQVNSLATLFHLGPPVLAVIELLVASGQSSN